MADTYDVTAQEDTTVVIGSRFVPARTITFRTKPSGIVSHVDVPIEQYAPARVDQLIAEEAAKLESVHGL